MKKMQKRKAMHKMKSMLILVMALAILCSMPVFTAKASENPEIDQSKIVNIDASKPILALGADLSAEQRQTVLSLMGITEADLPDYIVITITNDMEHQYLDAYMDPSVIGTKSLSSVMITPAESGHGVLVTTKNINYCTTGMYRNALLTAGVTDADIMVVGPTEISGTAALIGAIKGYEAMSGEEVAESTLDTAMDELITTGEIAELAGENSQEIEELIAFVKAKVAAGDLETEEDILSAIEEGQQQFGVSLSDEQIQKIIEIMQKINELGLDPQMLVKQAEDLYSRFGTDFLNSIDAEAIAKEVSEGFFSQIINAIKDFFSGLFS